MCVDFIPFGEMGLLPRVVDVRCCKYWMWIDPPPPFHVLVQPVDVICNPKFDLWYFRSCAGLITMGD